MNSDVVGTAKGGEGARQPASGLCSFAKLIGYRLATTDGIAGVAEDLYFDDEAWVVRFLVVDLRDDAVGRCVLMPPSAIERCDWDNRLLAISMSSAQLSCSPGIDTHNPVYRQHVLASLDHYSGLGYAESAAEFRKSRAAETAAAMNSPMQSVVDNPHLRSANEVLGYDIHALDGNLGRIHDFLIEEKSWVIRNLLVATRKGSHGRDVLIAPESVDGVEWSHAKVNVHLTRKTVEKSRPYESRGSGCW